MRALYTTCNVEKFCTFVGASVSLALKSLSFTSLFVKTRVYLTPGTAVVHA